MNDVQLGLTIGYGVAVLVASVAFAMVVRSTHARRRAAVDERRLALLENRWAVIVVVLLLAGLGATMGFVPYGKTDGGPDAQRVLVRAQQFGWSLQPATVRAGQPVEFRLRSQDVQHGFGVYDGTKLILQVQVPARGKTQFYVHTFDKPGTYEILCLEFCGFQHHNMRGALRVM